MAALGTGGEVKNDAHFELEFVGFQPGKLSLTHFCGGPKRLRLTHQLFVDDQTEIAQ